MLYYLSFLKIHFFPFNVFNYITVRAGGAILTGLFLTWFLAPLFITFAKSKRLTQMIRKEGPTSHQAKSNTPIMGGIIILFSTFFATLLWCRLDNPFIYLVLGVIFFLGSLGFMDDYHKWRGIGDQRKGIPPTFKMMAQLLLSIGIATYVFIHPPNPEFATKINVPYFKKVFIDLGIWYSIFVMVIIVGSSNAVNLTDGLDGLAMGSVVLSALTFIVFAYLAGHAKFSQYLGIISVPGAGELAIFLAALVGAGLGFLWYNGYPAQIFMGDTGSLFLGGVLGLVAVLVKQELILVVIGGLFVVEALSVLMQVYSFRIFKKRIFKMAPLHHHFELKGWHEAKVVIRFWIVGIVLSLIALSSLKLR